MPDIKAREVAAVIEEYLGHRFGSFIIRAVIICGSLGIVGFGLWWFFGNFVGGVLYPFFVDIFGGPGVAIDFRNIEVIVATLLAAISIFVLAFLIVAFVLARVMKRRVVPQAVIDSLAQLRSEGIAILNKQPATTLGLGDPGFKSFVDVEWVPAWEGWRKRVINFLGKRFTVAETLSLERLGLLDDRNIGSAVNPEHAHKLKMLAKQLTILENMIQRYQERR